MKTFIAYTKPNCKFCEEAKKLINEKGDEIIEVEIGKGISREEFMEFYPDVKTVPHIVLTEWEIGGFDDLEKFYNSL